MSEHEKKTLDRVNKALGKMGPGQKDRFLAFCEGAATMVERQSEEKNEPVED